jgi:hypothetical protein
MRRRVTGLVALTALAAAALLVIALTTDAKSGPAAGPTSEPTSEPAKSAPAAPTVEPAAQSRAEARLAQKAARAARTIRLFRQNGCWDGDAPAGAVPTHALVTLPGKQPTLVAAVVGYGIWLDGDPGQLHAFCP